VLAPGVKRLRHEAVHLSPSNAEVRNEWHYTSNPIYVHGVNWDNFTFVLKTGFTILK
jgi:hypothetical protein